MIRPDLKGQKYPYYIEVEQEDKTWQRYGIKDKYKHLASALRVVAEFAERTGGAMSFRIRQKLEIGRVTVAMARFPADSRKLVGVDKYTLYGKNPELRPRRKRAVRPEAERLRLFERFTARDLLQK